MRGPLPMRREGLPLVGLEKVGGIAAVVVFEEGAVGGVADVAAEAGGGVVVAAEADVVALELVVVGELAGAVWVAKRSAGLRESEAIQKQLRSETRSLGPPFLMTRAS